MSLSIMLPRKTSSGLHQTPIIWYWQMELKSLLRVGLLEVNMLTVSVDPTCESHPCILL